MDLRNFEREGAQTDRWRVLRGVAVLTGRLFVRVFCLALLLAACTPVSEFMPLVVTVTNDAPAPAQPQAVLASPPAEETPTLEPSPTPEFTLTPAVPAATDTPLPPLELPTERASVPAQQAWTGEPTYPGDSQAGRLFRVDYDPDIWAQTEGNFGDVVLAHRQINYCTITPWSGRGLPSDAKVQHDFRQIGDIPYDVNTVLVQDEVKFVAYVGGDQLLLTGFQVTFQDQKEQCLQDAETIFATLRSFVANPTITPSFTP